VDDLNTETAEMDSTNQPEAIATSQTGHNGE